MNVGTYLEKKKGHAVFKIRDTQTVKELIDSLNEKKVGALIVVNSSDEMAGIVSERDVLRKGIGNLNKTVAEIMTPASKVVKADKSENIIDVMKQFNDNRIRHLPVYDGKKLIGMVSVGDVISELLEINLFENEQLKNYILSPY